MTVNSVAVTYRKPRRQSPELYPFLNRAASSEPRVALPTL